MGAIYGGGNFGLLEYQGEIDFIHQSFDDRASVDTFLAYAELNYLLFGWVNAKAFAEYADNDGRLSQVGGGSSDTAQNRFGFGIEPFLGRYLQTRLFYTIANGPKDIPEANQNRLVLELHTFF